MSILHPGHGQGHILVHASHVSVCGRTALALKGIQYDQHPINLIKDGGQQVSRAPLMAAQNICISIGILGGSLGAGRGYQGWGHWSELH